MSNEVKFAVSLSSLNLARLEEELHALESAGCGELHVNVMDGAFVPDFGLGFDMIETAKRCCSIPCHAHLMIMRPEDHVERFVEAGCAAVTAHAEACIHGHRVLSQIREAGASPGIAVNPTTPLTRLDYLLDRADRVLLLAAEHGCRTPGAIRNTYDRVRLLKENLAYRRLDVKIEVEDGLDARNAALLINAGAERLVVDSAEESLQDFKNAVEQERKLHG